MENIRGDPCDTVRQDDGFQVPATVKGFLLNDVNRIRKGYRFQMDPVGEGFFVYSDYSVRNDIFLVFLFERVEQKPVVFFVDQNVLIRHKNRMIGRNINLREGCAPGERTVADFLQMIRNTDGSQRITRSKRVFPQLRKAIGKHNKPKAPAFCERFRSDQMEGRRKGNRGEGSAGLEGGVIDLLYGRGNGYAFQGRTADKTPFPDRFYRLWDGDRYQGFTPRKSCFSQCGHCFRNNDGLDGGEP